MPTRTVEPTQQREAPSAELLVGLKLVVVAGPDEGREAAVKTLAEVGTGHECQLQLSDPAVSRRHLSVAVVGRTIAVRDLGSRNGTFLGGARINEAEVPLGALLQLGDSAIAIQPRWQVKELAPSTASAFGEVLGRSVAMREVFAILERVAPTEVTVLIEGETGTGKELVARSIHAASPRREGPYVVFDCSAVAPELVESELFGHKRGAFSGAVSDRAGAFQRADGGTLCLDELGELPLEMQPKLLRVLETREVRPVGADAGKKVDVRVLASTNRELHAEVRRGRFREDLLYRIDVVRVRIPALRARPEDVEILTQHLIGKELAPGSKIAGDNLTRLLSCPWPGNVRELRNALSQAVTLAKRDAKGRVRFEELALQVAPGGPATIGQDLPGVAAPLPYKVAKAQLNVAFDRAYLDALMERHKGNVTHAAAAAGVSRQHLHEMLRRAAAPGTEPDEEA